MRWIFGDIHGMLKPLQAVVAEIVRLDPSPRYLFVGDYVNRGPESRGAIDFLLKLPNSRFIRGNHDDIFDLLLNGDCYVCNPDAPDALFAFRWFLDQGLDHTMLSYGVDYAVLDKCGRRPTHDRVKKIMDAVPAEHRAFIRKLEPVIEEPDLFVAHGAWHVDEHTESPGMIERLERNADLRYPLLWARFVDKDLAEHKAWHRTGYFGHTPVVNYDAAARLGNVPLRGERMMLLDTGAALGPIGRLTAYCPDNDTYIQATPAGQLVAEKR